MADAHPTVIDVPDQSGVQLNAPAIGDKSVRRFRTVPASPESAAR